MKWSNGFILGIFLSEWCVYCMGQEVGDVRLMNGGGEVSGFVEIYNGNQWGRVCDQAWDLNNAVVTCVQLGHNGAVESPTIPSGTIRPASGLVWLGRIMCVGNESRLMDCTGGQTWLGTTNPCQSAYVECVPFANGYKGCFWDQQERILGDFQSCSDSLCHDCVSGGAGCFRRDMTIEYCLDLCCMRDYAYAGVESANECFCGNAGSNYNATSPGQLTDSRCNQRCAGESGTRCGGVYEIQIYDCSAWTEPTIRCEVPAAPENGNVDGEARVYVVGDIVTFSCNTGYSIVGQASSLTCGINGQWNSSPPMCQRVVCPLLTDYPNAIPSTTVRAFDTAVTFECEVGYRHVRNEPALLTCSGDATWTGTTPLCRDENDCNVLPAYPNTTPSLVDGTAVGTTIMFTCSSGYTLENNETMVKTCIQPRTWIGQDPVCQVIDVCLVESPCQNSGRCSNTDGDYSCICTSGHRGKNCEFADVQPTSTPGNGTGTGTVGAEEGGFPTYAWVTILIVCVVLLLIFIAWLIIFRSRRKSKQRSDPRLLPNRTAAVSPRQYNDAYQNGHQPRYGGSIKPNNKHSGEYENNAYTDSLPAFSSATQDRTPSSHQRVTVPPGPSIGAGIARNVDRLPENTQHRDRSAFQPPRDRQRTAAKPLVVLAQTAASPQSSAASTPRSTRRTPLPLTSSVPSGNSPPSGTNLARPVARNPSAVSSNALPIARNPSAVSSAARPVASNTSAVPAAARPAVLSPSNVPTESRPVGRSPSAVSVATRPVARNPSTLSTSNRLAAIGPTENTSPRTVPPVVRPITPSPSTDSSVEESPVHIVPVSPISPSPTKPVRRFPSNIKAPPPVSVRPVQPPPTTSIEIAPPAISSPTSPPPINTSTPTSPPPARTPKSPPPVAPKPSPNAVRVLPSKTARAVPLPTPKVLPATHLNPNHSTDDDDVETRGSRLPSEKQYQPSAISPPRSHKRKPPFNENMDDELQRALMNRRRFSTSDEDSLDDSRGPLLSSSSGLRPGPSTGQLAPPRPKPGRSGKQPTAGELAGAPLGDSPRSASPVDSLDGQGDGQKGEGKGEEKKDKDMLDEFFDGVKEKFDDCTVS